VILAQAVPLLTGSSSYGKQDINGSFLDEYGSRAETVHMGGNDSFYMRVVRRIEKVGYLPHQSLLALVSQDFYS
jgi:hypothetical protein